MKLPDFDEMDELAEIAARAKGQIKVLEKVQKMMAAEFMQRALLTDKTYWIGGRHPTTVALEKIVAEVGITDDDRRTMEDIGRQIGAAYETYEEYSAKLQTCRDKIAVFQTESANRRFARI